MELERTLAVVILSPSIAPSLTYLFSEVPQQALGGCDNIYLKGCVMP